MTTPAWIPTLFQALDAFDTNTFASFLTDEAIFVFGNAELLKGKITIRDGVAAFFRSIAAIRHDLTDTWAMPDAVVCHGTATYTRHDGTQLCVPFANVFKLKNERIRDYLIYIDNTQLYVEL